VVLVVEDRQKKLVAGFTRAAIRCQHHRHPVAPCFDGGRAAFGVRTLDGALWWTASVPSWVVRRRRRLAGPRGSFRLVALALVGALRADVDVPAVDERVVARARRAARLAAAVARAGAAAFRDGRVVVLEARAVGRPFGHDALVVRDDAVDAGPVGAAFAAPST